MKCPVCQVFYSYQTGDGTSISLSCRRCKADLSDLITIYNQAVWYHREALGLFSRQLYHQSQEYNDKAIGLHWKQADFHTLAGKLWALQGEYAKAKSAWRLALDIEPKQAIAHECLELLSKLKIS
jgi:tetratricopeptide (TPR) repeat protein